MFRHFLYCDLYFYEKHKVGELMSRVNTDVQVARSTLADENTMPLKSVLMTFGNLFMLFYLSWQLTMIITFIIPLYFITTAVYNRRK